MLERVTGCVPEKSAKIDRGHLNLRNQRYTWGERTLIMGVVNVTPDSFSGDGCPDLESAVARARHQIRCGADIIDIGGESTRPGYTPVPEAEELSRVLPVVSRVRDEHPEAIISIDTTNVRVFREAARAGADILNSVSILTEGLLAAAVELGTPVVVMHNQAEAIYKGDVTDEVLRFLERQAHILVDRGLRCEQVILDPGIGFGKLPEHNLAILRALPRIVALGFPTLLGTSHKSLIGKLIGKSVEQRVFGTAATVALSVQVGIDIVRVHDVPEMTDVVRVADAIIRGWRPPDWQEA